MTKPDDRLEAKRIAYRLDLGLTPEQAAESMTTHPEPLTSTEAALMLNHHAVGAAQAIWDVFAPLCARFFRSLSGASTEETPDP